MKEVFKSFTDYIKEDVAVRGEVPGMGEVTFPSEGNAGSGDSFSGFNYNKNKLIQSILQATDEYKQSDLYTMEIDELNKILRDLDIKESVYFLTDQLANSMEFYSEKEWMELGKELGYKSSIFKKMFKDYWAMDAKEREQKGWDEESWPKWLTKYGVFEEESEKSDDDDLGLGDLEDELDGLGVDTDTDAKDSKSKDGEDEEEVSRLDKEAMILAKTDKTEEDLIDLSDEEIDAMYSKYK